MALERLAARHSVKSEVPGVYPERAMMLLELEARDGTQERA